MTWTKNLPVDFVLFSYLSWFGSQKLNYTNNKEKKGVRQNPVYNFNQLKIKLIAFNKLLKLISNSLIKSIITMKEVWLPGLNKFWRFYFSLYLEVLVSIETINIKHSRQCFIIFLNTTNFVKNALLHVLFSTLFSVFGCSAETLSLVFDIIITSMADKKLHFHSELGYFNFFLN